MSQTDRQTDKATWWSVTGFNDEIPLLEDTAKYPSWVKKVWGGRETCPKTGTLHFQGCIQLHTQMRRVAIKNWLPTSHLEPARKEEALKRYAMKEETATGEKLERTNPHKHYTADEICELIAYNILGMESAPEYVGEEGVKKLFNKSICLMLSENKQLAGQLMNPSIRNFWCSTFMVWINHARVRKELEDDAINGAPENEVV